MMLGLRYFEYLDEMYDISPATTVFLFACFMVTIAFFLAEIFNSMVIIAYNDTIKSSQKSGPKPEEVIKQEHWSYAFRRSCASACSRCDFKRCKRRARQKDLTNEMLIEDVDTKKKQANIFLSKFGI